MPRKKIDSELVVKADTGEITEVSLSPLDMQFQLPLEEQMKLIAVPNNVIVSRDLFMTAVRLAMSARVPLWGINIIPTKNGNKPYINADGIKFRLANDERKVQSDDIEVLKYPEGMGSTAIIKATIKMGNGQTYNALGAVKVDSQWNEANALLKAETKASRRAGYKAIANAVGMPMYDEDSDRSNGQVVEGQYRVLPVSSPKNVGQFLAWMDKQKITDEILLEVTHKDIADLAEKDIPEIYRLLTEWQGKQKELE